MNYVYNPYPMLDSLLSDWAIIKRCYHDTMKTIIIIDNGINKRKLNYDQSDYWECYKYKVLMRDYEVFNNTLVLESMQNGTNFKEYCFVRISSIYLVDFCNVSNFGRSRDLLVTDQVPQ